MSKPRAKKAQRRHGPALIIAAWLGAVLSAGLLLFAGAAVTSDFGSFRSCSGNNGLTVSSCGKQSLNPGDLVLLLLFVLSACLFVSLVTVAWRMSRRSAG